jgi:hypothetical protein
VDARQAKQVRTGLLLIAVGVLFLGSELNVWGGIHLSRMWPIVLLALGAAFALFPGDGGRGGAWWLILTGSVFLLHNYRVLSVRDSWPVFVVAIGVSVLAGGLKRESPEKRA